MYKLNIREVSYALSEALDMVGVDDLQHGKRVAYMAKAMAKKLNFSQDRINNLINIGMLHDCGVSNTDVHMNLVTELDWEGSQKHCILGANFLKSVDFYKEYADVVLYHHTHWSDLHSIDIDESIKVDANIILLVDRVDALRAQAKNHIEIIQILKEQKEKMFSSTLVDAFIEVSQPDSFWFYLEPNNLEMFLHEWIDNDTEKTYEYDKIEQIAFMFANIVDSKSSFTGEHSIKVSHVATYLGEKFHLSQQKLETLKLAALLHDLGKLRVDDAILEKKGPLNHEEKQIMNKHGFDSEMVLRKIRGFKDIATLASTHHETLDGEGYPYKKNKSEISLEARILMLSDVFQALVQDRPYRGRLQPYEVLKIIKEMESAGKVDPLIVQTIEENLDEIYEIAC